jgi:hypothetical protein
VRWLLPAFLHLTPNLDVSRFDPQPEHLAALAERGFLVPAKDRDTQEDGFVFGEAGMAMGVEFHRTWMSAVGFETAVLTPRGERAVHRAFLAPTGIANHLFLLESDASGACVANHQAMTLTELALKLRDLLTDALTAEVAEAAPAKEPAPAAAAAGPVCPACRANVMAGARFCPSCGKPLPKPEPPKPAVAFCPSCGAKVKPGARFCAACGTPLAEQG